MSLAYLSPFFTVISLYHSRRYLSRGFLRFFGLAFRLFKQSEGAWLCRLPYFDFVAFPLSCLYYTIGFLVCQEEKKIFLLFLYLLGTAVLPWLSFPLSLPCTYIISKNF